MKPHFWISNVKKWNEKWLWVKEKTPCPYRSVFAVMESGHTAPHCNVLGLIGKREEGRGGFDIEPEDCIECRFKNVRTGEDLKNLKLFEFEEFGKNDD